MKTLFKKNTLITIIILVLISSLSVSAASTRAVNIIPELTFTGQTANCDVTVLANTNDEISIIVKLWEGNRCIKTWKDSGTGYLFFSQTSLVTQGKAYKLTVDTTINNITQSPAQIVGLCP